MDKGKLYLIPTILGEGTQESTLPSTILKAIQEIDVFIVENLRTARRHIRKLDREKNIDATTFYSYGKYDTLNLEQDFLPHILSGQNVGLLSEAGLPCVADPGSALMVEKSGKELKTLRENVTSPNGTTAAALKSFADSGLEELVYQAMKAAHDRSIELSS